MHPNDIITSTVRPIRRLSAQIDPDQNGYVCSSGFVVLEPTGIRPELLLTFLRLPIICELMDLLASASMYPAISEAEILGLPLPSVDDATEKAVVAAVQEGRAAHARAHSLLDAAKRAVEIAIEDSEAAALAYLDKMGAV
jgi:type I restriction enzyme S subunit